MISANTVLNIIEESGVERLKGILPMKAYELIKKKYSKDSDVPYLKLLIKKHEKNERIIKRKIPSKV